MELVGSAMIVGREYVKGVGHMLGINTALNQAR